MLISRELMQYKSSPHSFFEN